MGNPALPRDNGPVIAGLDWGDGGKQPGFSDDEHTTAKKQTEREKFLTEREVVVPRQAQLELIEPHYPKTSKKGGRPTYPLAKSSLASAKQLLRITCCCGGIRSVIRPWKGP